MNNKDIRCLMSEIEKLEEPHHRKDNSIKKTLLGMKVDYDCYWFHEGFCTCGANKYNQAIMDILNILEGKLV